MSAKKRVHYMGQTLYQTLEIEQSRKHSACIYEFYITTRRWQGQQPKKKKNTKLLQKAWHQHKEAHLTQTRYSEKLSKLRCELWVGVGERRVAGKGNSLCKCLGGKKGYSTIANGIKFSMFSVANELKMEKDKLGGPANEDS